MFGEVDDVENFESCQAGLGIPEAEWVDCSRHLHSEREVVDIDGIRGAGDQRYHHAHLLYQEWKRLMSLGAGSGPASGGLDVTNKELLQQDAGSFQLCR